MWNASRKRGPLSISLSSIHLLQSDDWPAVQMARSKSIQRNFTICDAVHEDLDFLIISMVDVPLRRRRRFDII
jgi:hypothetical protein